MVGRRLTLVLVGKTRDFDIAEPKSPNQTFQHHQPVRQVDSIMVKVGVGR